MADLFTERITVRLPERYAYRGLIDGNLVRQLASLPVTREIRFNTTSKGHYGETEDFPTLAIVRRGIKIPDKFEQVIRVDEIGKLSLLSEQLSRPSARWMKPSTSQFKEAELPNFQRIHAETRSSWIDTMIVREERYEKQKLTVAGFRPPQLGALHAVASHWVVSDAPATLVMPTGTGKTETMLSLLISENIQKLLVIVPSDQLRSQISEKFVTLGVLKKYGLLSPEARFPIVATLKHAPTSLDGVDALFGRAQVIVATMQSISRLSAQLLDRVVSQVTHLFVDEAHHIGAASWKTLKAQFKRGNRRILQFTATPYRNDKRRVDGKFIFVYPLRRAREQNLFRPIHYIPIMERLTREADLAIIKSVGETLDRDLGNNLNHVAMARTNNIVRATELGALYRQHLNRYPAKIVHSKMLGSERQKVLEELRDGKLRVIICVDMLGEGFDMPRLKIAGLHDRHHSEAVTLQFIGRFTRSEPNLGDATVIAPVSLEDPREWLNSLYREDADWNSLLEIGSADFIEHQRRREELYNGLDREFDSIPAETITPKLNTFVFKTHCQLWSPANLEVIEKGNLAVVEAPIINSELSLVIAVSRHEARLNWSRVSHPTDVIYNLILAHWDQDKELLYVHSYPEDGLATIIAKAICGDDVELIRGEAVFRVLHGFRRVMLTNLGVKETHVRPIRFQFSTGIDISEQLEQTVENRTRIKTNLFGSGYVDEPFCDDEDVEGNQSSKRGIGCSIKGKIWSQEGTVSPDDWIQWCKTVGPKIADEAINTDMVLRNILRPKRQTQFPRGKIPISIDLPEGLSSASEDNVEVTFGKATVPLSDCELMISSFQPDAPVKFTLSGGSMVASFSMTIRDGIAVFELTSPNKVTVSRGKRRRDMLEIFREDPPAIRFTDGDMLVGADLAAAPGDEHPLYDSNSLTPLSWTGIDIRHESQGPNRRSDTVQYRAIQHLLEKNPGYDLIFDGDASGEVADVVAMRRQGRFLDVELFHCKFSSEDTPGARVADLYEICGQAMKAVRWADPRSNFMQRLRKQEENRSRTEGQSRFIKGDRGLLDQWITNRRDMLARFSMTLVQPGYSKKKMDRSHLPLLGAVQSYLIQTYNIPLRFWCSE